MSRHLQIIDLNIPPIPASGDNGKYLTNDGVSAYWVDKYHNHDAGIEGEPLITAGVSSELEDNRGKVQIGTFGEFAHVWFFTSASKEFIEEKLIPQSGWLDITANVDNYVCADRDTQSWVVLTSIATVDYLRYVPYFVAFKRLGGTHLHKQMMALHAHGDAGLSNQRTFACERYNRESGALGVLAVADNTLEIQLTGGYVWSANHRNLISDVTSATRHYVSTYFENNWYYYEHGNPVLDTEHYNGSLTVSAGHILRPNHLYKITATPTTDFTSYGASANTVGTIFQASASATLTGTDELITANVPVTIGKYAIAYIWRGIEEENHLYTAYSETEFDSIELAQASKNISIIPPLASSHAMFVGRIIYKSDTISASEILCEGAFDTVFQASSNITVHNSLSGRDDANAHPQYMLTTEVTAAILGKEDTGVAQSIMDSHVASADPHSQYYMTATATAEHALKANINNPSFTGTVSAVNERFSGSVYFDNEDVITVQSGSATVNWTDGNKKRVNWGELGDCTITFIPPSGSTNVILKLVKVGTVAHALGGFPLTVKWSGGQASVPVWTQTDADGGVDIIGLYYDGTNFYGSASLDMR